MNNLTVIDNSLVPIYQSSDSDEELVNARELHEFLGVGTVFAHWIKRRLEGFSENKDYILLAKNDKAQGAGSNRIDYLLTMDTSKHVAFMENNDKGREIRQYFIDFEKHARKRLIEMAEALKNSKTDVNESIEGIEGVWIEDLSDKGMIVRGDTRPYKDYLKSLGLKWNSYHQGWIYPKAWEERISKALRQNLPLTEIVKKQPLLETEISSRDIALKMQRMGMRAVIERIERDLYDLREYIACWG